MRHTEDNFDLDVSRHLRKRETKVIACVLLCLSLLLVGSFAHALSESDFAYGYTLEVDGDGAVYSLALPEAVYRGLTRDDLGDLRVFNSEGVSVPHHIARAGHVAKQVQADIKLPIYPLYVEITMHQATSDYGVHVVTDDKGAIIDINYGQLALTSNRRISAYLLDCSQLTQTANALILNWSDMQKQFVINAEVEGSNDLVHWQPVIVRSTLSDIDYAKHVLIRRRIDLPLHQFKYLRLSWLDGQSLSLSSVLAQFPSSSQSQDRQWSTFDFSRYDSKQNVYYFDTHSVLPADRVNIDLPRQNTLVQVQLSSAARKQGPWTLRDEGLLYNLRIGGNNLLTPAHVMPTTTQRYWRLHILSQDKHLQGKPVLRLGWIPEQLYFVAKGEAPFTLAYGSARVGPADTPMAQLLAQSKHREQAQFIKPAQLGSPIELGNTDQLKPSGSPFDWGWLVSWLGLLFSGLVLVFVVLRRYKQMDRGKPNE